MPSFATYGDCGDSIYLMPCMRLVAESHGPVTLYGKDGLRTEDPFTPRLGLIRDLFKSQPYIKDVLPWTDEHIDYDASRFRDWGYPFGVTLAALQAQWLHLLPDFGRPWISVAPAPAAEIVIARSPRYHNWHFPWAKLVEEFGNHMRFVGLDHEYVAFCEEFGHVERIITRDLNDVAKAIAGSEIFIGNQSSPFALAEAMKHPVIQETCLHSPDCLFPRPGAVHCYDGGMDVEILGHRFQTAPYRMVSRATLAESPPNGWRVRLHGHTETSYAFDIVLEAIKIKLARSGHPVPSNLREIIIDQSSEDMPPPPQMGPIAALEQLITSSRAAG